MGNVNLEINGIPVSVPRETTILNAAAKLGIEIPTLCYLKDLTPDGSCRMCVVEVQGGRKKGLVTACSEHCSEGMKIETNSPLVIDSRRFVLDTLLSNHEMKCITCAQNGACRLQEYCFEYGVKETSFSGKKTHYEIDSSNPYFDFDPNLCIMCRRCEKVCMNLQGRNTISINGRGMDVHMSMIYDKPWGESICESCGNCVEYCPVGALADKSAKKTYRQWEVTKIRSTCGLCGTGCQLDLLNKNNKVVGVKAAYGPTNKGLLCVKGRYQTNDLTQNEKRIQYPMIKKNGALEKVSWEEALSFIATRMNELKTSYGSDSIAGLVGTDATNEEYYLFQKLLRGAIGSNHIDNYTSQYSVTLQKEENAFDFSLLTSAVEDILAYPEVILLIESDPLETNPVIGAHIRRAVQNGTKLILVNSQDTELKKKAYLKMKIKPGTAKTFVYGLLNCIMQENLEQEHLKEFDVITEEVKEHTPEYVASICDVQVEDLNKAALLYANADTAPILHSLTVVKEIENLKYLAKLVKKLGKAGCGVNYLGKEANIQGAYDMGCNPYYLTGYQDIKDTEIINKFENVWGCKVNAKEGFSGTQIIEKAGEGDIKGLYVFGENLKTDQALEKVAFLVVQDLFMTHATQYADVVLPSTDYTQKEGTFTNTDRQIQRVRKATTLASDIKADSEIFCELMQRMGMDCNYAGEAQIMQEISSVTPLYKGVSHSSLDNGEIVQWPNQIEQ